MNKAKTKVLVVDDSAVVRRIISDQLKEFSDIEVVGEAINPFIAREKIAKLRPDVITLDIEMPEMDGLSFLEKLMQHHPLPVVIVSSQAAENSDNAVRALSLGAISIVHKPGSPYSAPNVRNELIEAIRTASVARVSKSASRPKASSSIQVSQLNTTNKIIAIGASTGGTKAVESVLSQFPVNAPGTVIVQHMPSGFTAAFADRLNNICKVEVREAKQGDTVVTGRVLIAPGGKHTLLTRNGANYVVSVKDGPSVQFQKPSVDVLFESVARNAGSNAVGAILTGMGSDGARGLLKMRQSGSRTYAQNEKTCVVFGMPKAAIELNAATKVIPLDTIAGSVLRAASE